MKESPYMDLKDDTNIFTTFSRKDNRLNGVNLNETESAGFCSDIIIHSLVRNLTEKSE